MRGEKEKRTVGFSYNEFVLARGLKNVFELSKICSKLHPLCKFDTPGDRFRDRIVRVSVCRCPRILWYTLSSDSKASSLERCFPVQCSFFWKFKNEWNWQYADRACACSSKRRKAELSTSDNWLECAAVVSKHCSAILRVDGETLQICLLPLLEKMNVTKAGRPKRTSRCPWRGRIFLYKSLLAERNKGYKLPCEHANGHRIHHSREHCEWLIGNITWQLANGLDQNLAGRNCRGWEMRVIGTNITYAKRTFHNFCVSPQSRSLFSASLQTFCLMVRAYLSTQKYGLFCSLNFIW